jgi:predicted PhzF superfamily epimerase YddE/YHI9
LKDSDQKLINKVELNFKELKIFKIDEQKSFGIIVAVKANLEKDKFLFFRYFAPSIGFIEYPSCGSAFGVSSTLMNY